MNDPIRRSRAAIIAVAAAILVWGSESGKAQSAPHLIQTKHHILNLDHIDRISFGVTGDGSKARASVFFAGSRDSSLTLIGEEAEQLRSEFRGNSSEESVNEKGVANEFRFLAFDGFDGKLALNWKPVRPDPSHVSLAKTPGTLTITTQRGSIHGEETKDQFGEGLQAKNLYLIDNPLANDADFVVTTCVAGFTPESMYHQAGLIVYDDDDNYLKWGYEYNWPQSGGQAFCCVTETNAQPKHNYNDPEPGLKRYWVRLTKRGDRYEYASSTDGKDFRVRGEVAWGDGSPKQIGILAKNGGSNDARELDAAFEFFELRAPAPERSNEGGRKE